MTDSASTQVHITEPVHLVGANAATATLGTWIAGLRYEAIPSEAVDHAKLCLLDALGCGLFGSQQPCGRISAKIARGLSLGGPSTMWGTDERVSASDAAMVNGTATHGFELDDIHLRSLIHPGSVAIPAAIALAEARSATGKDLLTAIIAGYEVGLRLGICAGVPHGLRGYHPTGTVGAVAAAAAAASILNLDPGASTDSLAIGATQAAGLHGARTGAMAKRFHAGRAAQSGVLAGLLAEGGFTGSSQALEAPFGGFLSTLSDNADLDSLTDGLSERWETLEVGFKPYAACASTHTTIDALDWLMRRGLNHRNVARLEIFMTKVGASNVGWPYRPAGVVAAQMNGFYAAAVKLLDGDVFIEQFAEDHLEDAQILKLIEKITIVHDPELDVGGAAKRHAVRVRAQLNDGRVLEKFVEQRRGSSEHPLTEVELIKKFHRTSGAVLPTRSINRLIEAILDVREVTNVSDITTLLRPLTPSK